MNFSQIIDQCGFICELLTGRHPIILSSIGLGITAIIFLKLRQVDKMIKRMQMDATELKQLASFPYCNDCPYKDICARRIAELNECQMQHRLEIKNRKK